MIQSIEFRFMLYFSKNLSQMIELVNTQLQLASRFLETEIIDPNEFLAAVKIVPNWSTASKLCIMFTEKYSPNQGVKLRGFLPD